MDVTFKCCKKTNKVENLELEESAEAPKIEIVDEISTKTCPQTFGCGKQSHKIIRQVT